MGHCRRRKSPLTLIELLIAIVLIAFLSGGLFGTWRVIHGARAKAERVAQEHRSWLTMRFQLERTLAKAYCANVSKNDQFVFNGNRLEFDFESGPDHDKSFAGIARASLFLENGRLLLQEVGGNQTRETVLRDGVKALSYEFLDDTGPRRDWMNTKTIPKIVLLHIDEEIVAIRLYNSRWEFQL